MNAAPESVQLTLPNGDVRTVAAGTTPLEVARGIGPRLAQDAVGAELDGRLVDLRQPLRQGGSFKLITIKQPEAGQFIRHSAEHVLADAVKRLWPEVEIDVGRQDHSEKYQYDFRFPRTFTPEDLERIEAEMNRILAEGADIERQEIGREEAAELFAGMGETLKVERLKDIPAGDTITIFRHGGFVDLCRGPHVQNVRQIGAVKLLEVSGVYWKGDEANEMLQRIYGTAFASAKELQEYLDRLEQARARDHRKLGQELDLFSFSPLAPASPFFHPRGAVIYNTLVDFIRELYRRYDYGEVLTPQILDVELWKRSGHYGNYDDEMFFVNADDRQFAVKPMNCPSHCLLFGSRRRSYRDLPIRYADFGRLHRYERSGVTAGLMRVRSFSQDDAHIFCTEDQINQEIAAVTQAIFEVYRVFGFTDLRIEVSTRPQKSVGSQQLWDKAESVLKASLDRLGITYGIDAGGGAFYGPKIDFQVKDALGRPWQLGTVQLDYQLPERFELSYIGADGEEHRPVMIHRAILGSLERFMGVLIEHTGGAFPLWLAPVQAVVLPVSEKFQAYAEAVRDQLAQGGLRTELDARNEKLGYRIREAQVQKVPYMLVVGAREEETATVSVRRRAGDDLGALAVADLLARTGGLIAERSSEL